MHTQDNWVNKKCVFEGTSKWYHEAMCACQHVGLCCRFEDKLIFLNIPLIFQRHHKFYITRSGLRFISSSSFSRCDNIFLVFNFPRSRQQMILLNVHIFISLLHRGEYCRFHTIFNPPNDFFLSIVHTRLRWNIGTNFRCLLRINGSEGSFSHCHNT